MQRIAMFGVAVLALGGAGAWWLLRDDVSPQPVAEKTPEAAERVVGLEQPLPLDETVELRWVDEATGEEDVWKVTKREISPEDLAAAAALPEPDSNAEGHVPDESARTLHAMGLESWKRGEIREAMAQLAKAVETDPEDPELQTHYGRLQLLAMDYREARPHLERAAALNPGEPQVWLDLATLYGKTGDIPRATAARRRAEGLVGDGKIIQDEMSGGLWVVEGTSIEP